MGGKHLKKVRAEKSKVHLRKKVLPKKQNVTSTTFTVKKIVAVEQLKKVDENEPVSNRNIPLKDLLIRLNHYNFTSRLNSLCGIKELLIKYPKILRGPYLKTIIEKILEIITDVEHKIRITAIDLLSNIFAIIPQASLVPFYSILKVRLGCAMTHRTATVQYDSLRFINVLVKFSPKVLKNNFKLITQNFTRILKNHLHECHSNTFSLKGSKKDLGKWKTEVLMSFYKFLSVGYGSTVEEEVFHSRCYNVNTFDKKDMSIRGVREQYKVIPNLQFLAKISENEETTAENNFSEFQSLCLHIMPLVFDTWTELSPSQGISECVLSKSTGELVSVLLKIIMLFYEKAMALNDVEMEYWFISNYGPPFKKAFTSNFPFLSISRPEARRSNDTSEEVCNDILSQNLTICYLSYSFKVVNKDSRLEAKMENYIISAILKKNPTEINILLKAVEVIINTSKCKKLNNFLINIVAAQNRIINPELQQALSKALMEMVLKEDDAAYLKDHNIIKWMKTLPEGLLKSQIFVQEIETILKLINKGNGSEILKEVEYRVTEILNNLPNARIEGVPQLEGQKLIANILYRCSYKVLEELVKKKNLADNLNLYPLELRNYIMDIFFHKLQNKLEFT